MIFLPTILSLMAGGGYVMGYAPFNLWITPLVAIFVLIACLNNQNAWRGAIIGLSFGIGLMGVGVSWIYYSIHNYGSNASPEQAAIITAAFCLSMSLFYGLFGFLYGYLNHSRKNIFSYFNSPLLLRVISFPSLWIGVELLRSHIYTGFPWLLFGDSMIDSYLATWAPIGGGFLMGFFAILSVVCLFHIIGLIPSIYVRHHQYKFFLLLIIAVTPWAIGAKFNDYLWTKPTGEAILIAAVQGNTKQDEKWNPKYLSQIADIYKRATYINADKQLILWPEAAVPYVHPQGDFYYESLHKKLSVTNTSLIYGSLRENSDKKFYNSIFLAQAEGQRRVVYDKTVLVPFGEYIPFHPKISALFPFIDLTSYKTTPGSSPKSFKSGNIRISPSICYEITLASYIAKLAKNSNLLVTISNDSWFGDSLAPHQHAHIARMRALENNLYLVRATANGITMVTDPHGKIIARLKQFQRGVLEAAVVPRKGLTPYQIAGDFPLAALSSLVFLIGLIKRRRFIQNI